MHHYELQLDLEIEIDLINSIYIYANGPLAKTLMNSWHESLLVIEGNKVDH